MNEKLKIAVIGAGISGLGSAYLLSKKHHVDIFEKENRLGGHARTSMVEEENKSFGVDTGFLVFNYETYPLLTKLFHELDVIIEESDMSFGFWDKKLDLVYAGDSLSGMFIQKKNLFNPSHYQMIYDILKFNKKANLHLETDAKELDVTLEEYLQEYSSYFKERYLIPMGAAIWSTPTTKMNQFPARTFLTFFKNHGLLGVDTHHQWLTVSGGSINYVNKIKEKISGEIFLNSNITNVIRNENGVLIINNGVAKSYDKVIFATHAPTTLELLSDATSLEKEILTPFTYKQNSAVLHNNTTLLHHNKRSYCAWNYKSNGDENSVTLSYWINTLQNLDSKKEYFVSLNETDSIQNPIESIEYEHPQFDMEAINMQKRRDEINGHNNTYFAGAYWRYGFHEDGLYSANTIAKEFGCAL